MCLSVVRPSKRVDTRTIEGEVLVSLDPNLPVMTNSRQWEGYRNLLMTMKEQFIGLKFNFS